MVEFDAALRYIDMENYDKAVQYLNAAIEKAAETDEAESIKYRCVLGELYANLGKREEAKAEFNRVIVFTNDNTSLPEQRKIATAFIEAIDGNLPMPAEAAEEKRPGYVPLIPKPVQDRGFINRQLTKKHR